MHIHTYIHNYTDIHIYIYNIYIYIYALQAAGPSEALLAAAIAASLRHGLTSLLYVFVVQIVLHICCRVKDLHNLPQYLVSTLNKTCVRQVVSDKWFPLMSARV